MPLNKETARWVVLPRPRDRRPRATPLPSPPLLKGRGRSLRSFGCSICCGLLSIAETLKNLQGGQGITGLLGGQSSHLRASSQVLPQRFLEAQCVAEMWVAFPLALGVAWHAVGDPVTLAGIGRAIKLSARDRLMAILADS